MALQLSSTTAAAGLLDGSISQGLFADESIFQGLFNDGSTSHGLFADGSASQGLLNHGSTSQGLESASQRLFNDGSTLFADGLGLYPNGSTGLGCLTDGSEMGVSTLNLLGLSDFFEEELAALDDNEFKKKLGGSLSDQLSDEPGLYEALKDLGFEDSTAAATGKNSNYVHSINK